MKFPDNVEQLRELSPDFMGMIFYEKSSRNVGDSLEANRIKALSHPQKIGVFVNAEKEFMLKKAEDFGLDYLQLHGQETPRLCKELQERGIGIIKVFSVGNGFDFSILKDYESYVDFFLFDTKGKHPGGNGVVFNWDILNQYPSHVPFFLSGGISLENAGAIPNHPRLYAIDVNSKFELSPGLKNIEQLKELKKQMATAQA
ncbi:MAG: phosphoribosylanthranilate isomerase [Bacteroidia bacterium]|nr:phosphoribosylanthranilate isomerase [Bacteroidia bacterium]